MTIYPVLLSGGSGTRLWPLSRAAYPKQFLRLPPSQPGTLFQNTARRLDDRDDTADPTVICSNAHRFIVTEQLEACGCAARKIYLEPVGRNTAPAVTVAALSVVEEDPEGIMVVMPCDHIMDDPAAFARRVDDAVEAARGGRFVLFGIAASEPHTGFGYIARGAALDSPCAGAYEVLSFVEKPDAETAATLAEQGGHYWNSGIFVLPAAMLLKEIERLQPELARACRAAYENARQDLGFYRLDEQAFAGSPEISLDHAVMEPTRNAVVLPLDAGWRDVGSWASLSGIIEQDAARNSVFGDAILNNVTNCLIYGEDRLVTGLGLENLVIADTRDVLLVAHKDEAQNVAALAQAIGKQGRAEHDRNVRQYRPWGYFESLCLGPRFQVKRLIVNPGGVLSLQMHRHRSEHWVVVRGTARITHGDRQFDLNEGESAYIPVTDWHRIENRGAVPLEIVEVQIGSYLGEDDIIRSEDVYSRESGDTR